MFEALLAMCVLLSITSFITPAAVPGGLTFEAPVRTFWVYVTELGLSDSHI